MLVFSSICYFSVLIAATSGMLVGYFWYSDAMFVKKWLTLSKILPSQLEKGNMSLSAAIGFAITLVLTMCLASIYHYFGSLEDALMALEFLIFFVAIGEAGRLVWEQEPITLYLINVGHKVISWLVIFLTYVGVFNIIS